MPLQAACDIEDDTLDLSPGRISDPRTRKHTIRCVPADEIPDETGRFGSGDPFAMRKNKTNVVQLPKTVLTHPSPPKMNFVVDEQLSSNKSTNTA